MLLLIRHRGFTLIEMMIAIAVLGIALAIAVPNFTDWLKRKRIEGAASDFVSLINFAKSEAVTRNAKVFLQGTSGASWKLLASTSSATCNAGDTCDLLNMSPSKYKSTQLVSISGQLSGTEINPIDSIFKFTSGSATQSAVFEDGNYQMQVNISTTGVTSICIPTGKPVIPGYAACS